ncbi:MAG: VCBS repeat-containing protein [Acidobacteria bacterium]|nr:VCBS repeat-containing protein [Acidobacteriota bacterium]
MSQGLSRRARPARQVFLIAVLLSFLVAVPGLTKMLTPTLAQAPTAALDFQRTDLQVQGLGPRGICAEDINGDEIPDLIVANLGTYQLYQSQTLDVYYGKGDGSFTLVQSLPVGDGNQPYGIAAADLRGIDRLDVIVPNKDGKTVSVFLAKADGTFEEPKAYEAGDAWSVSAADINGDGNLDLAVANFDSKAITILPGIGNGEFLPALTFAATADMQPRLIDFGDFNNDGRTDLVVPSDTFSGRVAIYFNNGSPDKFSFTAPSIIRVGELTGFAVVYDFNGDGNQDIATSSANSNNISVLLGKGDGSFAAPTHYWTGDIWPFGMVLTDFNGDGKPDLVLAGVKGITCAVLLGDGGGGFGSPYLFQIEGPSRWLATADFNLDGKTDIAVGNYTVTGAFETDPNKFFKTVSVMLNRSPFTPAGAVTFRVNCGGVSLINAHQMRFSADGNFDGGTTISTTEPILDTDDQALYQTARQGEFTYTAQVMTGRSYTLKLHFAEISAKLSKKRLMNVALNGKPILQRFSLSQRAKPFTAFSIIRRNVWPDRNGQIRLQFSGKKGGGICSAISIF